MMKNVFGTVVLLMSMPAFADSFSFTNGDGSKYSEICIAATQSDQAMRSEAKEHNMRALEADSLSCNGTSVKEFVKSHNAQRGSGQKEYAFTSADGNKASDLCIAAATSNVEFARVREELMFQSQDVARNVTCNGMNINVFARKYGNGAIQI